MTFIDTPPDGLPALCPGHPPAGGDTIWASTRAAYASFSQPIRNFLNPLIASHDFERSYSEERFARMDLGVERFAWARRDHPPTTHPGGAHPSRDRAEQPVRQPGLHHRDPGADALGEPQSAEMIFEQIQQPQFLVRRQWKSGTVAFWDNRVTQHYTVADVPANERVMYRVTILGDKPFHDRH